MFTRVDVIRKVPFFAELPEEDMERLCSLAEEVCIPAGAELFLDGRPGDRAFIVQEGLVEIYRFAEGRRIQIGVRRPGEVIGEMPLLEPGVSLSGARALIDTIILAVRYINLEELISSSQSAARAILYGITVRLRSTEMLLSENKKLAELGSLASRVLSELKKTLDSTCNGVEELSAAQARLHKAQAELYRLPLTHTQYGILNDLDELAERSANQPTNLDEMLYHHAEYEVDAWLEEHGIRNGWGLGRVLVDMSIDARRMRYLTDQFTNQQLPAVIHWAAATFMVYNLQASLLKGTRQMSKMVNEVQV